MEISTILVKFKYSNISTWATFVELASFRDKEIQSVLLEVLEKCAVYLKGKKKILSQNNHTSTSIP